MRYLFLLFFFVGVNSQVLNRHGLASQGAGIEINKGYILYQSIGQQSPQGSSIKSGFVIQQGFQQFPFSFIKDSFEPIKFKLYPNPFVDELVIDFDSKVESDLIYTISDMNGKLLYNKKTNLSSNTFKIEHLNWIQKGAYILTVQYRNKATSTIILKN